MENVNSKFLTQNFYTQSVRYCDLLLRTFGDYFGREESNSSSGHNDEYCDHIANTIIKIDPVVPEKNEKRVKNKFLK